MPIIIGGGSEKRNLVEECLFDFVDGEFKFTKGTNCEQPGSMEKVGSDITKRAIREMLKRYADNCHDDDLIAVDYGREAIESLLKINNAEGIRFYFGEKEKKGKPILSLILIAIDKDGKEIINVKELAEDSSAGKEVGTGNTKRNLQSEPEVAERLQLAGIIK